MAKSSKKISRTVARSAVSKQAEKVAAKINQLKSKRVDATKASAEAKTKAPTQAQLSAVRNAVVAENKTTMDLVSAIKAAGGDQAEVKFAFHSAKLALVLSSGKKPTDAQYAKAGDILKQPEAKRLDAYNRAYSASRMAWSRLLKDYGIVTTEKRGGDTSATRAPRAPAPAKAPAIAPTAIAAANATGSVLQSQPTQKGKPEAKPLPKGMTAPQLEQLVATEAQWLLTVVNANHSVLRGPFKTLVKDFAAKVAEARDALAKNDKAVKAEIEKRVNKGKVTVLPPATEAVTL